MYRHRTQTTETTRKVFRRRGRRRQPRAEDTLPHPNRQPCPIYPSDCPRSQVKMMKSNLANQTGRVWATPRQMSRHWGCGWMAGVQKGYGGLLAAEGRWGGRRTEGWIVWGIKYVWSWYLLHALSRTTFSPAHAASCRPLNRSSSIEDEKIQRSSALFRPLLFSLLLSKTMTWMLKLSPRQPV